MLSNPKLNMAIHHLQFIFYTKPHCTTKTSGNGVKRLNKSPFIGDKTYKNELSSDDLYPDNEVLDSDTKVCTKAPPGRSKRRGYRLLRLKSSLVFKDFVDFFDSFSKWISVR